MTVNEPISTSFLLFDAFSTTLSIAGTGPPADCNLWGIFLFFASCEGHREGAAGARAAIPRDTGGPFMG